jgi:hypothetical protein
MVLQRFINIVIDGFFENFPELPNYKMLVLTERGAPLHLLIRLMQLFIEKKTEINKLTDFFGLYYQIQNDYRNIFGWR